MRGLSHFNMFVLVHITRLVNSHDIRVNCKQRTQILLKLDAKRRENEKMKKIFGQWKKVGGEKGLIM